MTGFEQLKICSRSPFGVAALAFAFGVLGSPVETRGQQLELTAATIADINKAFDSGGLTAATLVEMYLARIEAYDDAGPRVNAILTLNPSALAQARELDDERMTRGRRSLLHGIPVVLKDNFDTQDMPTTAGSFLLEDSMPPDDAFVVRKLRDAGAIILAKVNMSEFASGNAMSSLGGFSLNPHDLTRSPSGSSGGTGVAIAAAFASFGLGTDTGGSVRGPTTANGLVGLKPTHGLLSRDGIIPLALSFDTGGPMARNVYDVALALGVMTGIDPADPATSKSHGHFERNYVQHLDAGALRGARLGILRDFVGRDGEVDWVVEACLAAMRKAGAEVVDIELPKWLLESRLQWYTTIRHREFRAQIPDYLATLGSQYPKTLQEMVERSMTKTAAGDGSYPNPPRWSLFQREQASGAVTDREYLAVRDHALPLVRAILEGRMEKHDLDALVYPTSSVRPRKIDAAPNLASARGLMGSGTNLANLSGFPDLILPAGFTSGGLPVGISFVGRAFSEARLLALGYAFEQATKARRLPVHTPPLAGQQITP